MKALLILADECAINLRVEVIEGYVVVQLVEAG
jgi:hypothetical protein